MVKYHESTLLAMAPPTWELGTMPAYTGSSLGDSSTVDIVLDPTRSTYVHDTGQS